MSAYEATELEVDEQTPNAPDPAEVAVADTGAGLLVYYIQTEYRAHLGRESEISRELIGFADVTDWSVITDALRVRGLGVGAITHLPEFAVDELHE